MRNFCYAVFGVFLLLVGCNISDVDFSNLKLEDGKAGLAIPFGTASYTMRELLEGASPDLNLEENEAGEMWFSYSTSDSYTFDGSIITILPTDNSTTQTFPATPADVAPQSVPFSFSFTQEYSGQDGEFVDSVYYDAGDLILDISTTLTHTISSYTVTIDDTEEIATGTTLALSGTNITSGSPDNQTVSVAGYKSKFVNNAGTSSYTVTVTGVVELPANEALLGSEQLTVRLQFINQDYEVIFGRFGQDVVDIASQSIAIDFFEDFTIDGVEFGAAHIDFDIRSSFGIPFGLGLSGVYGQDADGVQTPLTGSVVNTPRIVQSSPTTHPVTGAVQQTLISVTRQNSNLSTILAASPTSLNFNVQGLVNHGNANALNFVTDTSSIRSFVEMVIPMEVRLSNVQYELEFDIAGQADFSNVDSAALRVVTLNELPFGGTFDLHIIDASDAIVHTIANNRAFDQPFLNFDRSVREPKLSTDDVPLSKAGLDAMAAGEKIRIVFTLNSPTSQTSEDIFVKILAGAKMQVTLGARIIITTDL